MKNVFRLWKRKVLSYLENEAVVNIIPKLLKTLFLVPIDMHPK